MKLNASVSMTDVTRYITISGAPLYVVMEGADVTYVLDPRTIVIDYRYDYASSAFKPLKATLSGYRQKGPGDNNEKEMVSGWQMIGAFESDETPQWIRDLATRFCPPRF